MKIIWISFKLRELISGTLAHNMQCSLKAARVQLCTAGRSLHTENNRTLS